MKINTVQAAERLGVSNAVVHSMLRHKLLSDCKPKTNGAKKHFPLLMSRRSTISKRLTHIWGESGLKRTVLLLNAQ